MHDSALHASHASRFTLSRFTLHADTPPPAPAPPGSWCGRDRRGNGFRAWSKTSPGRIITSRLSSTSRQNSPTGRAPRSCGKAIEPACGGSQVKRSPCRAQNCAISSRLRPMIARLRAMICSCAAQRHDPEDLARRRGTDGRVIVERDAARQQILHPAWPASRSAAPAGRMTWIGRRAKSRARRGRRPAGDGSQRRTPAAGTSRRRRRAGHGAGQAR